jgi:phage-related protein
MLYRKVERGRSMNVHHYHTAGGKDLILNYINSLSKMEIVDGLSILEKFEQGDFDALTIKPWKGKVNEVYFYKHNRIFYVIVDGQDVYLLHACRKQKNKTEKRDGELVIKRARELGEKLSKKFV